MNKELQKVARQKIKDGLAQLPEASHLLFKRMYHHDDIQVDINDAVDAMDGDKLDYAMLQVQRSLDIQNEKDI